MDKITKQRVKDMSQTSKALLDYQLRITSIQDHLEIIDINDPNDVKETIEFCLDHCCNHFADELENPLSKP